MFERWSDFYTMIGGSSTGLIGLLFIVVTLSAASEAANHRNDDLTRGHSVYASPTVFHLGIVLLISASALAPTLPEVFFGLVLLMCGLVGLVYVGWVMKQFRSETGPPGFEKIDLWRYGVVPGCIYAALVVVSVLVMQGSPLAARSLSLTTICLLLIAVNNSWDLAGRLAHPARKQGRHNAMDRAGSPPKARVRGK